MAPTDRFKLPLRWKFEPQQNPRDGSIRWKWTAYTQSGEAAMKSDDVFDTLTECMKDAREHGYGG